MTVEWPTIEIICTLKILNPLCVSYWHIAWWTLVLWYQLGWVFISYVYKIWYTRATDELNNDGIKTKKGLKTRLRLMTRSSDIITQQFMIFCYSRRINSEVSFYACSPHHEKRNEILISCTSENTTPFDFFFNKYLQNARQWEKSCNGGSRRNVKGFAVFKIVYSVSNYAENSLFMSLTESKISIVWCYVFTTKPSN